MHKQSLLNNTVALFCCFFSPLLLGMERLVLDVVEVTMNQSMTVWESQEMKQKAERLRTNLC